MGYLPAVAGSGGATPATLRESGGNRNRAAPLEAGSAGGATVRSGIRLASRAPLLAAGWDDVGVRLGTRRACAGVGSEPVQGRATIGPRHTQPDDEPTERWEPAKLTLRRDTVARRFCVSFRGRDRLLLNDGWVWVRPLWAET